MRLPPWLPPGMADVWLSVLHAGNNGPPCRAGGHLDHVSGAVGWQPRPDTALAFHLAVRLRIKQPHPITYLCSVGSS
jgi:hypothetical protein